MRGQRLRVVITVGPTDTTSLALFRWLLAWVVHLHATSPAPMRLRVEVLPPEGVED